MTYWLCGIIIGAVMGLTGAGGALVAIPLFMIFLGMPLKIASIYSLLAVVIASSSNFLAQKHFTNYKTAFVVVLFSAIGSYLTAPYKILMPESVIAGLLIAVSLYALYAVWFTPVKKTINNSKSDSRVFFSIPVGIFLGTLTTFTGLGGGVLMMPVFLKLYSFDQSAAVATSLLAVALSSLASLLIQMQQGFEVVFDLNILFLVLGILLSALILKLIMKKISANTLSIIRKQVFTGVVLLAIYKLL